MEKTIHEWFLEAKANGAEWADGAIENIKIQDPSAFDDIADSMQMAIAGGFIWEKTPQGFHYWQNIAKSIIHA